VVTFIYPNCFNVGQIKAFNQGKKNPGTLKNARIAVAKPPTAKAVTLVKVR